MNRSILLAAGLCTFSFITPVLAHEDHNHAQPLHQHDEDHAHGMLEIPPGQPVPTVNLVVHPDDRRGWNLEVQLTNFAFAPERVNQISVPTEGHAHLYVDGNKIARLYGTGTTWKACLPAGTRLPSALTRTGTKL